MIDIARKIIFHDKMRFAITVSGVAFAVTLVCVQVGLFLGLLSSAAVTIEKADAEIWVTSRNTANVDFSIPFPESYVQRVRSVPGVERADNLIVWFSRINLPTGATEGILLYGLENFTRWNLPWNVTSGNAEDLRRGKFIMIDESAAARYGPFAAGEFRELSEQRMKIIGTTTEAKSFTTTPMAFMDYHGLQELDPMALGGKTTYVLVKLKPGANAEAVRDGIRERLPFLGVHLSKNWAKMSRDYWIVSTGLGMNMAITVFLGCLVGVVVVAQTLYTSVMDHFKEFATVKAIGGSNADIYKIIAKQAVIAAVFGFGVGAGIALAMQPTMASIGLALILKPEFFGLVFVGTVVLCLAASVISFRKISILDPALVFRS